MAAAGVMAVLEPSVAADDACICKDCPVEDGCQSRCSRLRSALISAELLISKIAILLQSLVDDAFQFRREFGIQADRRGGNLVQNRIEDRRRGAAFEGKAAGAHFIKHDSEGKKCRCVHPVLRPAPARAHVGHGAQSSAGDVRCSRSTPVAPAVTSVGSSTLPRSTPTLGQSEIENLGVVAIGDENIGRLNVAMDDVFGVSRFERVRDFDCQG